VLHYEAFISLFTVSVIHNTATDSGIGAYGTGANSQ
jgi:hypothetical protein